ncbi:type II toxin-antitoxin system RelE/ParE family toxin [Salegentibacter sp. HM20]
MLKSQPFSGKLVQEIRREDIREIIEGNYRIIYKIINSKRIDILTIHHSARDLSKRKIQV